VAVYLAKVNNDYPGILKCPTTETPPLVGFVVLTPSSLNMRVFGRLHSPD
jgi:hypothetical protein